VVRVLDWLRILIIWLLNLVDLFAVLLRLYNEILYYFVLLNELIQVVSPQWAYFGEVLNPLNLEWIPNKIFLKNSKNLYAIWIVN